MTGNSGKSVACVADMAMHAITQAPDQSGVRRTRWAAVRNTYGELVTTTIATFVSWFSEDVVKITWDAPIEAVVYLALEDGTYMHMTVLFIACDRPASVGKLKSLDLTGLWLNEASELDKTVLDDGAARVGRYPHKKDGADLTWCGVIMDTNSMDDDHWWHHLDLGPDDPEEAKEIEATKAQIAKVMAELGIARPIFEFFSQPSALLLVDGAYLPNPECENVRNQQLGAAYWIQLVVGKTPEWIAVKLMNQYGRVVDGRPVYGDAFSKARHVAKMRLEPRDGALIKIGLDFGLSPAAVLTDYTPHGQLRVLGEVCAKDRSMGLTRFLDEALHPYISSRFPGVNWKFTMRVDPSGGQRAQDNEGSCFKVLNDAHWPWEPAKTNYFQPRREAVEQLLMGNIGGGEPKLLLDPSCKTLIRGFEAGYHYRRIQVSGEARYSDEPYDNRFTHPHDALQYVALDIAIPHVSVPKADVQPLWMRKVMRRHGTQSPWRYRGGRVA